MRNPQNPSAHNKTRRRRIVAPSPGPGRFVTLTFVAIISVAAGTTLGATMYRLELHGPQPAVTTKNSVTPTVANDVPKPEPKKQKTVIAVKTRAVNPLPATSGRIETAALPVDSDRFGNASSQNMASENKTLIGQLREKKPVDGGKTGSILAQNKSVDIAETEAEIIELERKLTAEGAEHFKVPAQTEGVATTTDVDSGLQRRRTAKYVNLRAGPDNEADVLAIVPAKTELMAQDNCTHWCAAIYQGQKGYIYKTFFRRTAN